MKKKLLIPFSCILLISLVASSKTYYVTPDGLSANDGCSFDTPMDYATAMNQVVAGDSILFQGGIYIIPYNFETKNTIYISNSGFKDSLIFMIANDSIRVVFDFSYPDTAWYQDSYGFDITGNYWYFKGIDITRAGYQGAYVKGANNAFENCRFYNNRNTGLEINKGGSYTAVINCDAYRNYDPKKKGGMADGFGPKQTQGPGNKFIGCRAWENSDDGYDCYDSPEIVTFEQCWAFRNGVDVWHYGGFDGNGNGFKVGGNYKQANHTLTNCIAYGHPLKGFDQNNNTGGLTIYNGTSFSNTTNFGLANSLNTGQAHVLKNNISYLGNNNISNSIEEKNSWNIGFSVSESDFISLDTSIDTIARNADGTIPQTNLFQLDSTSLLIDAGVDIGLPFYGNAPDLGCFESPFSREPVVVSPSIIADQFLNYPNPFSYSTTFQFTLSKTAHVNIILYSITGKQVASVTDQLYPKGINIARFDGHSLDAGIYICSLRVGNEIYNQKITIVR